MVPLLPKLRGHFAEFLNHSYPERLSIFNLTTCVGLGYGPYTHIARGFSRQYRITNFTNKGYASRLGHKRATDLPITRLTRLHQQSNKWHGYLPVSPHRLDHISGPTHAHNTIARRRKYHACGWLVSMLYHGRAYTGTRISTGYPSTTPVGLALGPDSPWEDELDPGTLSHPAGQILTVQFVTHACILTRTQSTTPYSIASTHARRSPTQHTKIYCRGFGGVLEPHYIVGAKPLDQ